MKTRDLAGLDLDPNGPKRDENGGLDRSRTWERALVIHVLFSRTRAVIRRQSCELPVAKPETRNGAAYTGVGGPHRGQPACDQRRVYGMYWLTKSR